VRLSGLILLRSVPVSGECATRGVGYS
jgi:hypothetical protein